MNHSHKRSRPALSNASGDSDSSDTHDNNNRNVRARQTEEPSDTNLEAAIDEHIEEAIWLGGEVMNEDWRAEQHIEETLHEVNYDAACVSNAAARHAYACELAARYASLMLQSDRVTHEAVNMLRTLQTLEATGGIPSLGFHTHAPIDLTNDYLSLPIDLLLHRVITRRPYLGSAVRAGTTINQSVMNTMRTLRTMQATGDTHQLMLLRTAD
jgi:hypothetical protein